MRYKERKRKRNIPTKKIRIQNNKIQRNQSQNQCRNRSQNRKQINSL